MGRPSKKTLTPEILAKPALRAKVYVREDIIGMGKIDVLRAVGKTGSISKAAAEIGLGYRRAWALLEKLQNCFDAPLFVTERGGANAGGTCLTPLGMALIDQFDTAHTAIETVSQPLLKWLAEHQKSGA